MINYPFRLGPVNHHGDERLRTLQLAAERDGALTLLRRLVDLDQAGSIAVEGPESARLVEDIRRFIAAIAQEANP